MLWRQSGTVLWFTGSGYYKTNRSIDCLFKRKVKVRSVFIRDNANSETMPKTRYILSDNKCNSGQDNLLWQYVTIHNKYKKQYHVNAKLTKHSLPETPQDGEVTNKQWQNNATRETTDARTMPNSTKEPLSSRKHAYIILTPLNPTFI